MQRILWCVLCFALTAAAEDASERWMPYNSGGLWGFMARDAKNVQFEIPPTYELAYPFRFGLAAVRQNKLWGFIDGKNAVVIPFQFEDVQGGMFKSGVGIVKKGGKFGVIDRTGKQILPFQFKTITLDEKVARLTVTIPDPADAGNFLGLSGLYDLQGNSLTPKEYSHIYPWFKNGVTVVQMDGKYGLMSSGGELMTPIQFEQMFHSDISHFIGAREHGQKYDLFDERGRHRFSVEYPYVGALNDNRAVFKENGTKLFGFLDENGEAVIPAQFVLAGNFSEGLAIVQRKTGGPVEAIDVHGRSMGTAPNSFIRLDKFKNGTVWLADRTDKKVYLYDKKLQKVIPQGFQFAADFDVNGLARAQAGPKQFGLIDKKGDWVVQPEWTNIQLSSIPRQYIVSRDKENGIVSSTGEVLFKPQAISIEKWDEDFVKIVPPGFMNGNEYHCFWRNDGVFYYSGKAE